MKRQISTVSTNSNGSMYENGNVSPLPDGLRRQSEDWSIGEGGLVLGQKKEVTKCKRVRRRLSTLLHTHVALIVVSVLSSLDAVCVIGQVICDILIMSDKLADYDKLHERASVLIAQASPSIFNSSVVDYSHWSFERVIDYLEAGLTSNGSDVMTGPGHHRMSDNLHDDMKLRPEVGWLLSSLTQSHHTHHRSKRAADTHEEHEHDLLHELTHSFHIGSMALLSALLLETFLKIFAMGKHLLHHKLEVFDAFVIMVSWSLDVAFWEGIWARPGTEGATLLIFILPWRVIRIVNSFVLVIQEKDLVLLKVVKQRLRIQLRKDRESQSKLDKYRLEVRQLQGLCRKKGADEAAIQACCPSERRRRSSLFQSLSSLASVALISAMGGKRLGEQDQVSASESESDDDSRDTPKSPPTSPTSPDGVKPVFTIAPIGDENKAFTFDEDAVAKYEKICEKGEVLKTKL